MTPWSNMLWIIVVFFLNVRRTNICPFEGNAPCQWYLSNKRWVLYYTMLLSVYSWLQEVACFWPWDKEYNMYLWIIWIIWLIFSQCPPDKSTPFQGNAPCQCYLNNKRWVYILCSLPAASKRLLVFERGIKKHDMLWIIDSFFPLRPPDKYVQIQGNVPPGRLRTGALAYVNDKCWACIAVSLPIYAVIVPYAMTQSSKPFYFFLLWMSAGSISAVSG